MSKLQDIRDLAQEHAVSVSGSPRDWMDYMDTASRLYRYSFSDQLLIHAQHPEATACASLELWNEKMFRWVNRGARGIALLDETGQHTRLRYVFDISDTHIDVYKRQSANCLAICSFSLTFPERYSSDGSHFSLIGFLKITPASSSVSSSSVFPESSAI